MGGVPCIRDLRVTVSMVLGQLAGGRTIEQLLDDWERPHPGAHLSLSTTSTAGATQRSYVKPPANSATPRSSPPSTRPSRGRHPEPESLRAGQPALRLHRQRQHLGPPRRHRPEPLSWTRHVTLTAPLPRPTPKPCATGSSTSPGRITTAGRKLHLDQDWPWNPNLIAALNRIQPTANPTT